MGTWKCVTCSNTVSADVPPERCPSCGEQCEYVDVSCYIPECGGPGNVNRQVFEKSGESDLK